MKPRLIPVKVPWQVSASVSCLRVYASEGAGSQCRSVDFIAHFGLARSDSEQRTVRGVRIVEAPGDFVPTDGGIGAYRLVRVLFKEGLWVKVCPSHSDTEIIREDFYDWSALDWRVEDSPEGSAFLNRFWDRWRNTLVCPDPRMYQVEESTWLQELGLDSGSGWKHYMILGHDAYVEVIARDWQWEMGQSLG